jgi:hypothetical protein
MLEYTFPPEHEPIEISGVVLPAPSQIAAVGYGMVRAATPALRHLTDHQLAATPICPIITPPVTQYLRTHGLDVRSPLRQAHNTSGRQYHKYSLILPSRDEDSVIVDCAYKQFIQGDKRSRLPNVFIGHAAVMHQLMREHARTPLAIQLY